MASLTDLQNAVNDLTAAAKDFADAHRALASQHVDATSGNSDAGLKTIAQQVSNVAKTLRQAMTDSSPVRDGSAPPPKADGGMVPDSVTRARNMDPNQMEPLVPPGETAAEKAQREAQAKMTAEDATRRPPPARPSAA